MNHFDQVPLRPSNGADVLVGAWLKAYGKDILLGKPESFTELARHRRRESEVYALERDLRQARPVAQAAWEARDYAAVVKAFGHLRHALTPSEAERLKFAEEQLRPK